MTNFAWFGFKLKTGVGGSLAGRAVVRRVCCAELKKALTISPAAQLAFQTQIALAGGCRGARPPLPVHAARPATMDAVSRCTIFPAQAHDRAATPVRPAPAIRSPPFSRVRCKSDRLETSAKPQAAGVAHGQSRPAAATRPTLAANYHLFFFWLALSPALHDLPLPIESVRRSTPCRRKHSRAVRDTSAHVNPRHRCPRRCFLAIVL